MVLTDGMRAMMSGFVRDKCYADVQSVRQTTLRRLIRNNLFWQGHHYIRPTKSDLGDRVDWSPISANDVSGVSADTGRRAYTSSLNFYKGDAKKLIGILGRTPNAIANAIEQRNDEHVSEAADADTLLKELRRHWDVEAMQSYLVFCNWTCGTVYGYTPYGADARRYGVTKIPRYRMKTVEVEPGYFEDLPVEDGYDEYPNGSVSLILATDYEVIKPTRMKSLNDAPWLIYEREQHKAMLLKTYPEAKGLYNQIGGTSGGVYDDYGKTARDQASSNSAFSRPRSGSYWTESLVWLTPGMYDMMEAENSASAGIADELRAEHPDGAKFVFLNNYLIRVESENFHEVWFECPAEVGHSLDEPALGDETARINRSIDDMFNVFQEIAEKGNPLTLYDPNVIDPNAIRSHGSNPIDYLPTLPGQGGNLRQSIHTSEAIEVPESAVSLFEVAKQSMRENSGVVPALFGGVEKTQTLGEAEINRNMALLPHNVPWNFMRRFWAGVYTNGIRQLAKYGISKVYFGGARSGPVKKVDIPGLRALLNGNWYVECEEAIPMTWGQIRAQMFQLLNLPPDLVMAMGLTAPRNVRAILKSLGNNDFVLPGEGQRKKTLADINILLREQPIEQMTPMGPQVMSSRPPDEFEDDHGMVVEIVREWALEEAGRTAKESNPQGYLNVITWAQGHQSMIPPPMPEEGAPGGAPMGELPPSETDLGSMPPSGIEPGSPLVPEELAGLALEGA